MAAVMRQAASTVTDMINHASRAPRQTNDFIDRRAIVDVMAVMESVPQQGSDDEIWMISYMDIMTLLLTLFVLLLAYAKITPQSTRIAPTLQAEKHVSMAKSSSPQTAAPIIKIVPIKAQSSLSRIAALPKAVVTAAAPADKTVTADVSAATLDVTSFGIASLADAVTPPRKAMPQNVVPLRQELPATPPAIPAAVAAREKLLESMRNSPLGQRIELTTDQDNVSLEISDNILFDPGSATLKQNGQLLLDELAALLAAQDYTVSVEGHSDNVAFSNAHFASNWELSATRATNVTRYLIARGIVAARLRAIGYADTRPRADNDSVQGRARNRRVSLVLHMPVQAQTAAAE